MDRAIAGLEPRFIKGGNDFNDQDTFEGGLRTASRT